MALTMREAIGKSVGRLDSGSRMAQLWQSDPDKFIRILGYQQTREKKKDLSLEKKTSTELQRVSDILINPFVGMQTEQAGAIQKSEVTAPRRAAAKELFTGVVTMERERQEERGRERKRMARGRTRGAGLGRSPFTSYGVGKELLG